MLIWHKEIGRVFADTATESEYMRYNKKFQDWLNEKDGAKKDVEEDHVRDFI